MMFKKITKAFLMKEQFKIDPAASVQALSDIISNIRVTNKRDTNRISLAKEHLRGIKRQLRSLNERILIFRRRIKLTQRGKIMGGVAGHMDHLYDNPDLTFSK